MGRRAIFGGFPLVLLVLQLALVSGCAHTLHPSQAPQIPMESVRPFGGGLSVDLVNAQPDNTANLFGREAGNTFFANYNEWTEFFITYWANELGRRDVQVGQKSPNRINVKLDNFGYVTETLMVRANMKIHLSSPDNTWKKDFEESDASGWSRGRAFGSLIHHSVEKLMKDPEVMGRMK